MIVSLCAFLSAWCAREPPIQLPDEDKARKFEEVDNILPSARYDAKDPVEAARRLMATSSRSGRGSRQAAAKGKAGGGAAATPFNWREDWRTSYRSNFAKEHGGAGRLVAPGLAAAAQAAAQPRGVRGGPNAASGKGFLESTTSYKRDFLKRAPTQERVPASAHFGKQTMSTVPMPGGRGEPPMQLTGREGTSYHLHYEPEGEWVNPGGKPSPAAPKAATWRKAGDRAPPPRRNANVLHRPRTAASAREFLDPQQERMRAAGKPLPERGNASYDDWERTNFPKAWRKTLVRRSHAHAVVRTDAERLGEGSYTGELPGAGLSDWPDAKGLGSAGEEGDGTTYKRQFGAKRAEVLRARKPHAVVPTILAGPRRQRVFQAQTTYNAYHTRPATADEARDHTTGVARARAKMAAIARREWRVAQAAEAAARVVRAAGAPPAEAKAAALEAARDAYEEVDLDDECSTVITTATMRTNATARSRLSRATAATGRGSLESRLSALVAGAGA